MNEQFVYDLFSKAYYRKDYRKYNDNEVSVTQTTTCLLKSFFNRKITRQFADRKKIILMWGTLLHRAIQTELKDMGFNIEEEAMEDIDGVTLYGHVDAINRDGILEFKGVSRLPHETLSHHALQTIAYTYLFDAKVGYVAYVHKGSGIVKVYPVIPDAKIYDYIKLRAVRLSTHLQRNVMPQPEPSWECQYCEYMDMCPAPRKTFARQVIP